MPRGRMILSATYSFLEILAKASEKLGIPKSDLVVISVHFYLSQNFPSLYEELRRVSDAKMGQGGSF
ncbi:MAG: hypothetical protein QXP84_08130 [Candidatus Korarchaeum sp.]